MAKFTVIILLFLLMACGDINYAQIDNTTAADDATYSTEPVNQKGEADNG